GFVRRVVVETALVGHVTKSIQMRERSAMWVDGGLIPGDLSLRENRHLTNERVLKLGRLLLRFRVDVVSEGDRFTRADERRRLLPLLLGNRIHRAELVILAPTAPIRQLLHPPVELRLG